MNKTTINANFEAFKEIARWVVFFVISWIATQMLAQMILVPEFINAKVWVFTFMIPIRAMISFGLSMVLRYADKFIHEMPRLSWKGLLPF